MIEPPSRKPDGGDWHLEPATPQQVACLQYLGMSVGSTPLTQGQAATLLDRAEGDVTYRERLFSWKQNKEALHPDLFTGDEGEPPSFKAPSLPAYKAPSAPAMPSPYSPTLGHVVAPSAPSWQAPNVPAALTNPARKKAGKRNSGALWLVVLVALVAAGVGAYARFGLPSSLASLQLPAILKDKLSPQPAPSPAPTVTGPKFAAVAAKDSQQRAIAKYPDLGKPATPMNLRFVAIFKALTEERSPRLLQPNWPESVADECAGSLRTGAVALPNPTATRVSNAAAPAPVNSPAQPPLPNALFISLDAEAKRKTNTTRRGSQAPQIISLEVSLQNRLKAPVTVIMRSTVFVHPYSGNMEHQVFSTNDKPLELTPNQSMTEITPEVTIPGANIGVRSIEYDGWLVQLLSEKGDQLIKQVGSTGTLEEYGKRPSFIAAPR